MKHLIKTICTLLLVLSAAQMFAQADQQAIEKAWMAYMTPGEVHKLLAKDIGEWKADMTLWMDPTQPGQKSTAKVVNTMIMGGRYQESRTSGTFAGMPFEGYGLVGYDNARKILVSTWLDNMGTGIMYMEGTYDDKTRTANFAGKSTDPLTGKELKVRETFKWLDDNTQLMEMFMEHEGKEFKSLEIKFTRVK